MATLNMVGGAVTNMWVWHLMMSLIQERVELHISVIVCQHHLILHAICIYKIVQKLYGPGP